MRKFKFLSFILIIFVFMILVGCTSKKTTSSTTDVPTTVPTTKDPTTMPTTVPITEVPTEVPTTTDVYTEVPTPTQTTTEVNTMTEVKPPIEEKPEQYSVELSSDGKYFTYGYDEKVVQINEKAIYVDGRLSDAAIKNFPYVYNTFNDAIASATNGTEDNPMVIYLAPYVYWIHDPASKSTKNAYGITKSCSYLNIIGLSDNPDNVVIAGNYGHDEGYNGGNWTMFNISGDGLTLKNVTFGGYCNVDLVYPLNPELNYPKRTSNITQCQIGSYSGDKLYAENCNFISRLNMMPFISSKRALYVNCHMESTDDSLNGSSGAVYLGCDFEFYSSKPWVSSSGVTLLDCDIKICHINKDTVVKQYLSKMAGRFNVIDTRFTSNYDMVNIGWSDVLSNTFRSYYSNVTHNGEPVLFDDGGKNPDKAVDISGTGFLNAYKITTGDKVIYNVYNLLRGNDGWDPLGQKEIVEALGYDNVATSISVSASSKSIESGVSNSTITYSISGPQSTSYNMGAQFVISDEDKEYVTYELTNNGKSLVLSGKNEEELPRLVIVKVITDNGIEGAAAITVSPKLIDAPKFISTPTIIQNSDGTATVSYELDLNGRNDMSRITWYVSDNSNGSNKIAIAVGRNELLNTIELSEAYVGKYLVAYIEPKHILSNYGNGVTVISSFKVLNDGIKDKDSFVTDFSTLPTDYQSSVLPGFITLDGYKPADTSSNYISFDSNTVDETFKASWSVSSSSTWTYGTGVKGGVLDYTGIYQTQRGARLMYTALDSSYGDMNLEIKVAPGKTAAQGFGSQNQYMDILIKFDSKTMSGYGVRIYRNTGDSCKIALVEWRDGKQKLITDSIVSSAYLTECTIKVWTINDKLYAKVTTSAIQPDTAINNGYVHDVYLECDINENNYGGFMIVHTGTVGDNVTYIGSLSVYWNENE